MDVILTNATMTSTLYIIQVPTIDIDVGIIPDKISCDVTLNEVFFSYPSRPDVVVSCHSSHLIIEFSMPTGNEWSKFTH